MRTGLHSISGQHINSFQQAGFEMGTADRAHISGCGGTVHKISWCAEAEHTTCHVVPVRAALTRRQHFSIFLRGPALLHGLQLAPSSFDSSICSQASSQPHVHSRAD